uniref:Retrotransposon protein, putative, Ty3-gypsy subclass n=1 Tax=Oryza sativa subsp. japonica TaxID=39947 RepID=Q2QTB5_ORYSJ|nr:retrotransposon protein, putative, Ty3-gypsy subclass [Oryza sativa Japonica Group]
MEQGGPCDGLCRFRIHLGTRGDCPLPAGDGVKPEVWCAWLEGVMRRVLSRPLSEYHKAASVSIFNKRRQPIRLDIDVDLDCIRIKSTGMLVHPKASFGPALELSRSPRPRVFSQHYPNVPEYSTVPPLSGELPHHFRLEVHGYVGTCLANTVVEASGGSADHACQEAAYLMMARLRDRHNYIFYNTAYRFHPRRASGDDASTFRPTAGENNTTFGHMCAVMRGMDRMHSDLHKASKALNDGKLVRIIALKDEIARLKKENAQLKGLPAPGGVRIRTTPRKSTTAPVRIQLAPKNPPLPAAPPAAPVAPAPAPAPVPVSAPASALSFAPASAARGPASGNGGWLPTTPSGSRDHSSSSSSGSELGSGETYLPDSRSRSEGPGDEQEDAFDSTDCRSRSEH